MNDAATNETTVYAGPVYRVNISGANEFPYIKLCPMAMAFREWVYANDMFAVAGTTTSGPDCYIADFPMEHQEAIEAWIDAYEDEAPTLEDLMCGCQGGVIGQTDDEDGYER